jgi:outer membrane protein
MKNLNYIIHAALAAAIIILFVLHFVDRPQPEPPAVIPATDDEIITHLPVAYVNLDTLLQQYHYAVELNEAILRREENVRASLNQQASALEAEAMDFRRKLENNAFLTRERAEQEQQRLLRKEQDIKAYENRQTQDLLSEHQRLTAELRDTILSQLKQFNSSRGYRIIFSNTSKDNIILADDVYDITNDFVTHLNRRTLSPSVMK